MTRWALLIGGKDTDKSAAALRVAGALTARGVTVAGVVQQAIEEDGERVAYRLCRLGRADAALVARRAVAPRSEHEEAFCSFVFDTTAFTAARRWLAEDAVGARVVLIDDVSKLEAAGRGHHDAIRAALDRDALPVLVVRADQLFAIMERFGLDEPLAVLDLAGDGTVDGFADAVAAAALAEDGSGRNDALARWRAMHAAAEGARVRQQDPDGDRWAARAARFDRMSRREGAADGTMDVLDRHLRATDVIVDVGAGTGRHTVALARRAARVIAVEPSAAMRGRLEARLADERLATVTIVPEAWPLAHPIAGDVVLSSHVLYGVESVEAFLRAMTASARRLCAVVLGMRPPEHAFAALWERIHGTARPPRPAAPEAFAVLRQLGLRPLLEQIPGSDRPLSFAQTDEDLTEICHRLGLAPAPHAFARVRDALAALAPTGPDGAHVLGRVGPNALVWWATDADPTCHDPSL
ncbi:MAG: nucleoside-triphosphatase [Candidatus Binatia bacterium]